MNDLSLQSRRLSFAVVAAAILSLSMSQAYADPATVVDHNSGNKARVMGRGTYQIGGSIDVDFRFFAKAHDGRHARGKFRQTLVFQGLLVDFSGKVTCLAVDPANGRAWIGGVVTENNSDHLSFKTEIHEPGRDVWFRVLDTGKHSGEADRSTFLGFEGGGGIITSEEYCDARIWPGPPDDEPNARTNPVVNGKIKLKTHGNNN